MIEIQRIFITVKTYPTLSKRYNEFWAKNPFVIIGVFYPPSDNQLSLF